MFDVAVIGCGAVGAAAACALARREVSLLVLEAENDVAAGTTKANSAILHAGYDPKPGTKMARLNVRGAVLAKELCAALDVPRREIGSLVLAFTPEDEQTLSALLARGGQNGVKGLRILTREETLALEPALAPNVRAALLAPGAAVVSPWEYALAMAENAVQNGARLELEAPVTAVRAVRGGWRLFTPKREFEARFVLNAAGVNAPAVHALAAPPAFEGRPSRGQYWLLDKSEGNCVRHVIFQCPGKMGKGVLVTPTVHGNLLIGPNAEPVEGGDTATTAQGLEYVAEAARRSVPGLNLRAVIRSFAGVRAVTDRGDFCIEWAAPGFLDLAGIKSPGLTAAAAIGEEAVRLLEEAGLELPVKAHPITQRRRVRFAELSDSQRAELAAREPAYGRVVCRCETVTEGEILAACRAPIPPRSVDAVKRRVNAGMGRCQGGFCGPRVVELLARELRRDPTEILQDKAGSNILTGHTKAIPQIEEEGGGEDA